MKQDWQQRTAEENPLRSKINLRIDALVLEGLNGGNHDQIARAVERELANLLIGGGIPETWKSGQEIPNMDGGKISIQPGPSPGRLGGKIARAVYGGIWR